MYHTRQIEAITKITCEPEIGADCETTASAALISPLMRKCCYVDLLNMSLGGNLEVRLQGLVRLFQRNASARKQIRAWASARQQSRKQ